MKRSVPGFKPAGFRRAAPPPRKANVWEFRFLFRIAFWYTVVLASLIGAACWFKAYREGWQADDLRGAPLQTDNAVVLRCDFLGSRYKPLTTCRIWFRIRGRVVDLPTTDVEDAARIPVGAHIPVQFRIGRSGAYYVDSWQLPAR